MRRTNTVVLGGGTGSGAATSITIGTTTITSGTDTRVLFDDGGNIGESAGLTYSKATGTLLATVLSGTLASGIQTKLGTGTGLGTLVTVIGKGAPGATTTGTSEQTLATVTIPANTLTADGDGIRINYLWKTANNGGSKRIIVRLGGIGGTILLDSGASTGAAVMVTNPYPPILFRTGATTFASFMFQAQNTSLVGSGTPGVFGGNVAYSIAAGSATWANANDLVFDAVTATTAGDITLIAYSVELIK